MRRLAATKVVKRQTGYPLAGDGGDGRKRSRLPLNDFADHAAERPKSGDFSYRDRTYVAAGGIAAECPYGTDVVPQTTQFRQHHEFLFRLFEFGAEPPASLPGRKLA